MYGRTKKKSPRNSAIFMDWIHIIIGIVIVVLAVITFLNPENNRILFPIIFLLAAVLDIFNGAYKYRQSGRNKKKKVAAAGQFVVAGLLLVMTLISAISIWR